MSPNSHLLLKYCHIFRILPFLLFVYIIAVNWWDIFNVNCRSLLIVMEVPSEWHFLCVCLYVCVVGRSCVAKYWAVLSVLVMCVVGLSWVGDKNWKRWSGCRLPAGQQMFRREWLSLLFRLSVYRLATRSRQCNIPRYSSPVINWYRKFGSVFTGVAGWGGAKTQIEFYHWD